LVQILGPDNWRLWPQLRLEVLAESATVFTRSWSGPGDTEQRWRAPLSNVALNVVIRLDGVLATRRSYGKPVTERV
jgi:hypothetical protein